MRTKIILIVIFSLSVFLICFTRIKTEKITSEISSLCCKTDEKIRRGEENCYSQLEECWQKSRAFLSMLYHHSTLNDIEEGIARSKKHYEEKDEKTAITELENVRFKAIHLTDGDELSWENVF